MNTEIEKLTQILRDSNNIVFFGGAASVLVSALPGTWRHNGPWQKQIANIFPVI